MRCLAQHTYTRTHTHAYRTRRRCWRMCLLAHCAFPANTHVFTDPDISIGSTDFYSCEAEHMQLGFLLACANGCLDTVKTLVAICGEQVVKSATLAQGLQLAARENCKDIVTYLLKFSVYPGNGNGLFSSTTNNSGAFFEACEQGNQVIARQLVQSGAVKDATLAAARSTWAWLSDTATST